MVQHIERNIKQHLPHAEVVILAELGHYPHHEAPEQVVPKMLQWLSHFAQSATAEDIGSTQAHFVS